MIGACSNKKILVTGGAGFVGSHLVDRLSVANEVVVLDNLSSGSLSNLENSIDRITFVKGDVLDAQLLKDLLGRVGVVFHLAARVDVAESVVEPVLCAMVNIIGTINILEACKGLPIERFVYSSSAAVYGDTKCIVNEEHSLNPVSPYGVSKLAAEQHCLMYHRAYGVPVVILRYFNVYGGRQNKGVIPIFLNDKKNGVPSIIYGDGEQTRDFIGVKDVVDANILAVIESRAIGQIFNIASGKAISINQIAGRLNGDNVCYDKVREGEIRHSHANIEKAQRMLAYEPSPNLVVNIRGVV